MVPCEWDWPPERVYLPSGPMIDIDPPHETGAVRPTKRRLVDVLIEGTVAALKLTVVLVILFAWLIFVLMRL